MTPGQNVIVAQRHGGGFVAVSRSNALALRGFTLRGAWFFGHELDEDAKTLINDAEAGLRGNVVHRVLADERRMEIYEKALAALVEIHSLERNLTAEQRSAESLKALGGLEDIMSWSREGQRPWSRITAEDLTKIKTHITTNTA